ncbi:MAG TPA: carbonic anhydrase, partial [Geobacteraceae bacterium]|nr:carbonic anhydrase [Geobacteraceae bacterium]
ADEALHSLMEGNAKFISGDVEHLVVNAQPAKRLDTGINGQKPYAIVVTCSDSRLSPEILFDKGIGEVFVVRVAGNVVAPHELGSIEYAAEHLGAKLVMVLGHSKCGAVSAAYDYFTTPETLRPELSNSLESIVDSIDPAVNLAVAAGTGKAGAEDINVDEVVKQIKKKSRVIREMMETSGVKIIGGKYDVVTGAVSLHDHE